LASVKPLARSSVFLGGPGDASDGAEQEWFGESGDEPVCGQDEPPIGFVRGSWKAYYATFNQEKQEQSSGGPNKRLDQHLSLEESKIEIFVSNAGTREEYSLQGLPDE